jgi:hypothetical protein
MRRTFAALVEVTVETTDDDEYTSHDLAEALMELEEIPHLVPHDVVMYQTSAHSTTHKWNINDKEHQP